MSNLIDRERRKMRFKDIIGNMIAGIVYYLFFYPYKIATKVIKLYEFKRDEYWFKNERKLKEAMISEIATYVARYIAKDEERRGGFNSFIIYNAHESDELNYMNTLHLRSFIEFSFYTKHSNLKSKLYKEKERSKYGDKWNANKFYSGLMKTLEKELTEVFPTESVKLDVDRKWNGSYECIRIKREI